MDKSIKIKHLDFWEGLNELLFWFQITEIPTLLMGKMDCWLMPTLQVMESKEMPILMMMNTGPLDLDQVSGILTWFIFQYSMNSSGFDKQFKYHEASYALTVS